ncbi:MAG: type II secretion system GspH family protein [Synergistaceae bacterium]|jgi:prepilin-type N-terminal cleavage/methylation domain-containing protein|nr:type II secretion system GspH family protein [Synergistaceae bacterium]
MTVDVMETKSRGFSLVEVLIVIMVIGILAGMSMFAFGSWREKTQATVILSELDSAKNAMLAYSMQHRTRTSDGLDGWGLANTAAITASLDKYLDAGFSKGESASRFGVLRVSDDNGIWVGFQNFPASDALKNEINKKVSDNNIYSGKANGNTYSLWLKIR